MLGLYPLASAPLGGLATLAAMSTARVALVVQNYSAEPERGLQLLEASADTSDFNRWFNSDGQGIMFAKNTDVSTRIVQFEYVRRTSEIIQVAINVLAGKTDVFGPFAQEMLNHAVADDAHGEIYVDSNSNLVLLSAVRLPGLTPPQGGRV